MIEIDFQLKSFRSWGSWSPLSLSPNSFLRLCYSQAPSYPSYPFFSCPHFLHLHLIHESLFPLSFLFPPILPSAFSSFSGVSFLALVTFIYIVIPATLVRPQLLHQRLFSLGLCTSSCPPAISTRWRTRFSQTQSPSKAPPHPVLAT